MWTVQWHAYCTAWKTCTQTHTSTPKGVDLISFVVAFFPLISWVGYARAPAQRYTKLSTAAGGHILGIFIPLDRSAAYAI